MKKLISLIVIVALMAVFMFGVAYAVPVPAETNSQACHHVPPIAQSSANEDSAAALKDCGAPGS